LKEFVWVYCLYECKKKSLTKGDFMTKKKESKQTGSTFQETIESKIFLIRGKRGD